MRKSSSRTQASIDNRRAEREEARRRLDAEEDFVCYGRYDNSLRKLCARYPDGCSDETIARALMISDPRVVEDLYQLAVSKIQAELKIDTL